MIGLRDFCKKVKGYSFIGKTRELRWELKYAFQRAWRGYDDVDVFSLYDRFNERMILTLKDFAESNNGLWTDGNLQLTEEETDKAIKKMIRHFERADIDGWVDLDLDPSTKEGFKGIEKFSDDAIAHQMAALRDFQKWFYQLWI